MTIAGFLHRQQRCSLAIHSNNIGLRRKTIAHVRDVAQIDGRSPDRLDRQIGSVLRHRSGGCRSARRHIRAGRSWPCRRQNQILVTDGTDDRGSVQALLLHRLEIEIDLNLPLPASIWIRQRCPLDRSQLSAKKFWPISASCCSDRFFPDIES